AEVALGLAPSVGSVATRARAKPPDERFADMAEMGAALQAVLGISTASPALSPEARRRACLRHLDEARRLLAGNDPEAALLAARQARALEPSMSEVLALLETIEERLRLGAEAGGSTAETVDLPPAGAPPTVPS